MQNAAYSQNMDETFMVSYHILYIAAIMRQPLGIFYFVAYFPLAIPEHMCYINTKHMFLAERENKPYGDVGSYRG